jgi:hypothetical protein
VPIFIDGGAPPDSEQPDRLGVNDEVGKYGRGASRHLLRLHKVVGIGTKQTLTKVYEYVRGRAGPLLCGNRRFGGGGSARFATFLDIILMSVVDAQGSAGVNPRTVVIYRP